MGKLEEVNVGISHNTLSTGTIIKGEIVSEGDFRIDGSVEGSINCKGKIIIGTKGSFKGNIKGGNIDIMGYVQGNLLAKNSLSLKSTAKLEGEVQTKTLIIEEGAIFNGSCKMTNNNIGDSRVNTNVIVKETATSEKDKK